MPQVKTTYLVLSREQRGAGDSYSVPGSVTAVSGQAAIRAATEGAVPGLYVAVPARNWTEAEVENYTPPSRTRVKIVDRPAEIEIHTDQMNLEVEELAEAIEGDDDVDPT